MSANLPPAAVFIDKLGLQPHPEGGWYRETYRSPTRVETTRGSRSALTNIFYLLEQNQLSRWHVVQADELWSFQSGAPLELLEYDPGSGRFDRHILGYGGANSTAIVQAGVWQAARSLEAYSLVSCAVAPGFEFVDFQFVSDLPSHADYFKGDLAAWAHFL